MPKTSKPLTVWVHPKLWEHPAVQDLIEKGNHVETHAGDTTMPDLLLSPVAWRIVPGMEDTQIPMAIKAARKERYGKATSQDNQSDFADCHRNC